ncbi:hypothetical protein [Nocardia amamiensis]|uniref:hypothetical protein n=1 Tax=Nocardia amamiensis TaxID=404578 RepID=UPI0008328486|nr:hypothetical protein [Nocardia amamiensis]
MSAPLDQSVLDLLRQSAVGPMLDRPVNDVLKDMGLPPLPDISGLPPLPEFPPLPVIDLSLLAKPLTDLASSFGTGQLPAAPQLDPAQVLSQVSTVVQTAMTLGTSALQVVMQLWQSMGASSAAQKAGQAASDGTAVASQSAATSAGVTSASGSVFQGASLMAAIIAKFMTSLAASAPFLGTPGGQVFVVALTTETLAEATAVVAKTRGELTVHSAQMTKTGQKVPVTNAPKNVDPMQTVSQLMQLVGPLTQMATTGAQALQAAHTALNVPKSISDPEKDRERLQEGEHAEGAEGAGAGPLGAGVGGPAGTPARQLTPWAGARGAGALGAAGASMPVAEAASTTSASAARGMTSGPGMVPMAGAAGAAGMARAGEQSTDGVRGLLVTEQHGNEVVGEIEGASLPVVGAAEQVSEPLDSEPPDKSLTL